MPPRPSLADRARAALRLVRDLTDPDRRELRRLRLGERRLLQPWPTTSEERYPDLFDAIAEQLAALPEPRILSFGCSNGAEVRALRRRLPGAMIVGIDANRRMIARARADDSDARARYEVGCEPPPGEIFDAVLACAVLRHGSLETGTIDDATPIFPFSRFADAIGALDRAVAPGGLLALTHMHYRFADTNAARHYAAQPLANAEPAEAVQYAPDGRQCAEPEPATALYRKASGAPDAEIGEAL